MISFNVFIGYLKLLINKNYCGIITIGMQHGNIMKLETKETFKKDEELAV